MPDQYVGSIAMWLRFASTLEDWDTYQKAYTKDRTKCKEALQRCKDPYMRKRLKSVLKLMDFLYTQQRQEQGAA